MQTKISNANVETAFKYFILALELPKTYMLLHEGRYWQIIHRVPGQAGHSQPFGNSRYTAREMYNLLWFANNAHTKAAEINRLFAEEFPS